MRVGMLGMGKLGLPVCLAIESKGHEVKGYDVNPAVAGYLKDRKIPYKEEGLQPLLDKTKVEMTNSIEELCEWADLVFCAVQTPHDPLYEGASRLPEDRKDFDYSWLKDAVSKVPAGTNLVVISTCLPGTFKREIEPLVQGVNYVYSPLYIAMGTVLSDYLNPEYALIGSYGDTSVYEEFLDTIHKKPKVVTDIATAEAIKVFYNTAITAKIILANSHMQVAHKMGLNIDDINRALMMATDRIVSTKYMRSGGPDSGGCHPRDLIALSWLGEELDMKPNWFEMMAYAREKQTEWTADIVMAESVDKGLPIVVLGKAFKPETNLTAGSGATLVANILREKGAEVAQYDPLVGDTLPSPLPVAVYFVATEHRIFADLDYPSGSVVVDLWRYIKGKDGVEVIGVGNAIR